MALHYVNIYIIKCNMYDYLSYHKFMISFRPLTLRICSAPILVSIYYPSIAAEHPLPRSGELKGCGEGGAAIYA